jgi:hypothetical protein
MSKLSERDARTRIDLPFLIGQKVVLKNASLISVPIKQLQSVTTTLDMKENSLSAGTLYRVAYGDGSGFEAVKEDQIITLEEARVILLERFAQALSQIDHALEYNRNLIVCSVPVDADFEDVQ